MIKIGQTYYYFRRVPQHVQQYDSRKFIKISLKTKNEEEARRRYRIYDDYIEEFWRSLIRTGGSNGFDAEYKTAIMLARAHGFAYKSAVEIARSSLSEVIERVQVTAQNGIKDDVVAAVLGGVDRPSIPLSVCIEKFWPLCADRLSRKSDHQVKKWKNARIRAMNNFIGIAGDKDITNVTRKDILKFQQHWLRLIEKENYKGDTANKQFSHVKDIISTVANSEDIEMDIEPLFKNIYLEDNYTPRPSFEAKFVQEHILNPANLANLNIEARFLIYVMADTGARESEIIGLDGNEDVFLNADIPHIWIREKDNLGLKTPHSDRKIPLVGSALYAFQQMPKGITRYTNPDAASSLVNKYLLEHNLRPTEKHTLYSLRHTFKDRLRDIEAPEEIIDELMGHAKSGPQYGRGRTLEKKHEWLKKIAFKLSAL